jgi:hypothetical protein
MGREEWLLVEFIQTDLDLASDALLKVDDLESHMSLEDHENPDDYRWDFAKLMIGHHIENALRGIGALAERLRVPSIERECTNLRKDSKFLKATSRPFDGDIHSDALSKAYSCFAPLRAMSNAKAITSHGVLRNILNKTAVIIKDRGLVPRNESDVRNAILEVCNYSFIDAMREVGIPRILKHTKGDIGVPSLRTMIEFKFINSKSEMKSSLDGVYADMKGYKHNDWDTFYGVFYMTQPFYTQEDVEKEFEMVSADKTWTPIVVHGPGTRTKRTT